MSTILPGKAAARIQRATRNFSFRKKRKRAAKTLQRYYRGRLGRQRVDWIKKSSPKTEEECIAYMHDFPGEPIWLETTIDIPYCTKPIYYSQLKPHQKQKLIMMCQYYYWAVPPTSIKEADRRARRFNTFVYNWKASTDGSSHIAYRFFAKRSFRVRFQASFQVLFWNQLKLGPDEIIYIKPVNRRFVRHYSPKTIAGVMDWTSSNLGEDGFKRLIKTSWDLRHGVTRNPTAIAIDNVVYPNPVWPNGHLVLNQINILQEIAKVVLNINEEPPKRDSMGWNDFDISTIKVERLFPSYKFSLEHTSARTLDMSYLIHAVKLHTAKLLTKEEIPISDILTPANSEFQGSNVLQQYIISTDRNVPRHSNERLHFNWRLAYPITTPGFRAGKDDITFNNQQAFGDMMAETEIRKKDGDNRWKQMEDEYDFRPEFEQIKLKLRF